MQIVEITQIDEELYSVTVELEYGYTVEKEMYEVGGRLVASSIQDDLAMYIAFLSKTQKAIEEEQYGGQFWDDADSIFEDNSIYDL